MTRTIQAALLATVLTAAAACSSSPPPAAPSESTAPGTVSTNQPSSPPERDSSGIDSSASPTSTSGTLPGLSVGCSATIHAQTAVNKLFADAITPSNNEPSDTSGAADPSSSAVAGGQPITDAAISAVFGSFDGDLPAAVAKPFATMKAAAESVVDKDAADVSEELTSPETMNALTAIADYISDCTPAETH